MKNTFHIHDKWQCGRIKERISSTDYNCKTTFTNLSLSISSPSFSWSPPSPSQSPSSSYPSLYSLSSSYPSPTSFSTSYLSSINLPLSFTYFLLWNLVEFILNFILYLWCFKISVMHLKNMIADSFSKQVMIFIRKKPK